MVNALYVWGLARATGRTVILRIEDHDRVRSRPAFDAALREDLAWLGFEPDEGPYRQAPDGQVYAAAVELLRFNGLAYACDCSRATFAAWRAEHGSPWAGGGCPGGCRERHLREGVTLGVRIALGAGEEAWDDLRLGPQHDAPDREGDLLARDRDGNWTYPLCVVVDDLRQGVDLVVRGEDLLGATARQIRLGRLLGRTVAPEYFHHALVRKPGGAKLSKADRDTSVRDLRAAGLTAAEVIGRAAAAVGLAEPGVALPPDAAAAIEWVAGLRLVP